MEGWVDRLVDGRMYGWIGWVDGWMGVNGWMGVGVDRWMDGWMDGRADGRVSGLLYVP